MLKQRKRAPDVRNNDVCAFRQFRPARITLQKLDAICQAICRGKLFCQMNNVVGLDGVNALCSRAASKEREHARPAADLQYHITRTDSPGDRAGISVETARVANHFSVRAEGIHISVWRARRWNQNRQISTL